jgi:two-component system chemotaxis sensor kinase CheA
MTIDMSQFYQPFFEEADELLVQTEHLLLAINIDTPSQDHLDAIFRAAHSIKGGAATFGFQQTTEITHTLENLLDQIRSHKLTLTQEHIDTLLYAKDIVSAQLEAYRQGQEPDPEIVQIARSKLDSMMSANYKQKSPTTAQIVDAVLNVPTHAHHKDNSSLIQDDQQLKTYRIELLKINRTDLANLKTELTLLGSVASTTDHPAIFNLDTYDSVDSIKAICSFIVDETDLIVTDLSCNNVVKATTPLSCMPVSSQAPSDPILQPTLTTSLLPPLNTIDSGFDANKIIATSTPQQQSGTSIRVGLEKVDQLINLVGELVITQAMIEQNVRYLVGSEHTRLFNSINQLTRNTKDIQEAVMSMRMVPIDYIFSRFPRMVRDLAIKLDKKIDLVTEGAATELDKNLIEQMIDPLTHLVRNSIDHGIEPPDQRRAAGKLATGQLTLSASNRGGNIVIEVSDDGAGLNRERILNKAREKGLAVSDAMQDSEVWQLIFVPGFSTSETITEVSGRGVGMDVVKRNVNTLGGSIQIQSKPGSGTVMSISMPLTLAIIDGMTVALGEHIFILPLSTIVETLQPSERDIKSITGEGLMIEVRGEYLQIIALHTLFDHATTVRTPTQGVLVVIETDGQKAALLVDRLVGQQQVVIKSLEKNFRKIKGISGATIMGDGTVALILDARELIELGKPKRPLGVNQ